MKLYLYLTAYTKISSKQILDQNLGAKTIKILEENRGIHLFKLGLGSGFLDTASKAQVIKEKIENWTLSKLKMFVLMTPSRSEKTIIGENICKSFVIRKLYSKYIKSTYNLAMKKIPQFKICKVFK